MPGAGYEVWATARKPADVALLKAAGFVALQLDLNLPGYSQLRERLMPSSERLGVNDVAPEQLHNVHAGQTDLDTEGALIVAIELDDQHPWPPKLPTTVKDAGILDSRESRQKLLEQMTRFPPARLAIACDPRRSPDRGSLALIGELARSAAATRIWLLQAPPGQALDADRLSDWHHALEKLGDSDNTFKTPSFVVYDATLSYDLAALIMAFMSSLPKPVEEAQEQPAA